MGDPLFKRGPLEHISDECAASRKRYRPKTPEGLKPKDLVGIPWRVALALQQPYEHHTVVKETDRAWLAAFMDGEGCISIRQHKGRMVDEGAIKFLSETLGGWYYKEKPHCNNGRPLYCWQASDKHAGEVAIKLLPFLRVKRQQAEMIIGLRKMQADGMKHRTKVTGYRMLPHHCGKNVRVANKCFSDEYVAACDKIWCDLRKLNGLARFQ